LEELAVNDVAPCQDQHDRAHPLHVDGDLLEVFVEESLVKGGDQGKNAPRSGPPTRANRWSGREKPFSFEEHQEAEGEERCADQDAKARRT